VDVGGRRETADVADLVLVAPRPGLVGVEQLVVLDALDDAPNAHT
jgi:hypothetical protein